MLSACGDKLIGEPDLDTLINRFNLADPTADLSRLQELVESRTDKISKFVERSSLGRDFCSTTKTAMLKMLSLPMWK